MRVTGTIKLGLTVAFLLFSRLAEAADQPAFFQDDVFPLLESRCLSCHGADKQEGNLRLDSWDAARIGGDRGPALVPADVSQSLLITAITFSDPDLQMPPKQKLSDSEIELLTRWVREGAVWPQPVRVLFEDEPEFLAQLINGAGRARLTNERPFAGSAAFGITPLQRDSVNIPGWRFPIRQNPKSGEYRFLRLAWKKRGAGSVMLELATDGHWPDAKEPKGRYVAGPNHTGWSAISVAEEAPSEWKVETFDLWKDMGDSTLTGLAPTCDQGEEAFFDSLVLGPTLESLNAYRPSPGGTNLAKENTPVGDAWNDKRNPIRKLFRGERLDLWSWKVPQTNSKNDEQRGDYPVTDSALDRYILPRLKAAKLDFSPLADRRTLIRRLTFDLLGLPPTPVEVQDFVSDESPDAYDKLVERLLASPRYGERQARLWLDVVRYADTNGYERDEFRPLAWQYRDYVIRAFNEDLPYDQFIREQLAGDEIIAGPPQTQAEANALVATGFLRLGQWDSTASIFQEEDRLRAEQLADLTNTTASAFLGMTMSCCQCHDHKYDPLSQADHFRLRAFFAGVQPRDDLAISLAAEQFQIDAHNAAIDQKLVPLHMEFEKLDQKNTKHAEELKGRIAALESEKRAPRHAMGATDSGPQPPSTHILYQGDFSSPREEVQPGFVSLLEPGPAQILAPRPDTSGRRLTLANWIASPSNPWTARVFVNRIWQQHFGTGIVATPNDLGYTGSRPTHPELLDWLSIRFIESDWSVKDLHRLIVKSRAYRQCSQATESRQRVTQSSTVHPDPDNTLLWRQNLRRLDAETLRDSLLSVSGQLRPYGGGKPLWPEIAAELRNAQPAILEAEKGGDGGRMQGWYTDPIELTDVRSIFLVRKRCLPIPFLQAFDLPDSTVSCARRDSTVVAPQALMLLNSPDGIRYARALSKRLIHTARLQPGLDEKSDQSKPIDDPKLLSTIVTHLFQTTLNRAPDEEELKLALQLMRHNFEVHHRAGDGEPAFQRSVDDLCRAVLNLNEFIYID